MNRLFRKIIARWAGRARQQGDKPRQEGDKPRQQGDNPRQEGDKPRQQGDNPRQQGEGFAHTPLAGRLEEIMEDLGNSFDLVTREVMIGQQPGVPAAVIYMEGISDHQLIRDNILRPMLYDAQDLAPGDELSPGEVIRLLKDSRLSVGDLKVRSLKSDLLKHLVKGDTAVLVEGYPDYIVAFTRAWEGRRVEEPENEAVIRGPREGFTETLLVNLSLLRRRLKTPYLRFDPIEIGRYSQSTIIVAYIQDLVNPGLVVEAKKRLENIDTDAIISIGYIEEFIEDSPYSPFPQFKATERPDVVAASLAEGRVAVLAENSPYALLLPTTFFEMLQGADDYYQRYWYWMFMVKILRLLAINLALLLPAFYVAVTTFHQELIPTALLVNIAAAREGIPFPAVVEAILMETTFELLREAGLRLPNIIGPAVTIVGALVLGEAALRAGIVSSAMVIVVALTAIANFSMPNFSAAIPLRLLRFPLLILGGILGLFGVLYGLLLILVHLVSLRSFGVPYIAPLAPLMPRDLKDSLLRFPHWAMGKRPRYLRTLDPVRQGKDQMPHPPPSPVDHREGKRGK